MAYYESSHGAIITFNGPDGCGKSTVAKTVACTIDNDNSETLLIGSSEFKNWLHPDIFKRYIGSVDRLERGTAVNASTKEKTALYEDIAICLYGLAAQHAKNRGDVIVHSDPYLKRLIWAKMHMSEDNFWQYATYLDDYMSDKVGDNFASHAVTMHISAEDTYGRILQRDTVDEYDPSSKEETLTLVSAVDYVESHFLGDTRPYPRLFGVAVLHISNPSVQPDFMQTRLDDFAAQVNQFVKGC